MKYSMATVCLGGTLEERFAAISAAGYDGVEIFEHDLRLHKGTALAIKNMAADLGLEIMALGPFRDFEGVPASQRSNVLDLARKKLSLMNDLGINRLLVCSNTSLESSGDIFRIANDLNELGDLAQQFEIEVGFEALAWGHHIWDYRKAWEVVELADHSSVGIVLDNWHIMARELPLEEIKSIPAEKIVFVQLADAPKMQLELLEWSRHHRCFPGQGDWDMEPFYEVLEEINYDGWVSHEIFNDKFRIADPKTIALDGIRSFLPLSKRANT
ncbi:MAG: sugar phosphate isomerase/epimerase [Rhodobacteraceae bacterium]|nr:sugar phosphate isomerase/epimerase [Paracoccaceae bacterium]